MIKASIWIGETATGINGRKRKATKNSLVLNEGVTISRINGFIDKLSDEEAGALYARLRPLMLGLEGRMEVSDER